jgi:tetratricopeptide (TPR) repeat protein
MNRLAILITTVAALVTATTVVWMEVRQEREFRRLIAAGDEALDVGRTSEAIEAFSGALAFRPGSMLAHLKRADTYRRRGAGDLTAALRDAREAHSLDPDAPQPIELLGDIHSAMARYDEAVDFYSRYSRLDDRAARVFYKLGMTYVRHNQSVKAIAPLRRAIDLDDHLAEAHYVLGLALRDTGAPDEAVAELRRSVELNPALLPAREELAVLYLGRGRVRDGIEQLNAIAALEPEVPAHLVDLALAFARSGQSEAAIVTLNGAADRHAGSPVVVAALGRVWLDVAVADDDPAAVHKAIAALQPLARRPDATSEILALLGEAMLMSDQVASAERVLQQAVTRQPIAPAAYLHLAAAARRRGHTALAHDAEARYARLVPAG